MGIMDKAQDKMQDAKIKSEEMTDDAKKRLADMKKRRQNEQMDKKIDAI